MRDRRKPSTFEWLFCIAVFILGAGLLGLYVSGNTGGRTPENDLASAEDVATNVSEYMSRGVQHLNFTVADYLIEYDGAQPKFQQIRSAVQSRRPIQAWVSKKNEALFPIGNQVTLYKLSVANRSVLTYDEAIADQAKTRRAIPILGGVLMGLGALVTAGCFQTQRRYAAWARAAASKGSDGAQ